MHRAWQHHAIQGRGPVQAEAIYPKGLQHNPALFDAPLARLSPVASHLLQVWTNNTGTCEYTYSRLGSFFWMSCYHILQRTTIAKRHQIQGKAEPLLEDSLP